MTFIIYKCRGCPRKFFINNGKFCPKCGKKGDEIYKSPVIGDDVLEGVEIFNKKKGEGNGRLQPA